MKYLLYILFLIIISSCIAQKNIIEYSFASIEIDRIVDKNTYYQIYVDSDNMCKYPIIKNIQIISDSIYKKEDNFYIFIVKSNKLKIKKDSILIIK